MLLSDNTRTFYGRSSGQVEDRYLAHVFGAYRAILEEHLPVTVTCDWNLNEADLARQKVLILPKQPFVLHSSKKPITVKLAFDGGLKPAKVVLWDADQRLAEKTEGPWTFEVSLKPGIHALIATVEGGGRPHHCPSELVQWRPSCTV